METYSQVVETVAEAASLPGYIAEAGARVVTCDVDQAALDRLRGELPQVPAIPADVADEAAIDRALALEPPRPPERGVRRPGPGSGTLRVADGRDDEGARRRLA